MLTPSNLCKKRTCSSWLPTHSTISRMDVYAPQKWLPHEKPTLPGSPSNPIHPLPRRFAFLIVGLIVAITGGLGNALVSVNLPYLQGSLGVYSSEIQWLPAAYVMANVSMNLLLVKFRQQFGLRLYTELFLVLYAATTLAHLFVHGLASAIAVRATNGMAGAALTALGLYYTLQAFPAQHRLKGVVLGICFSQLRKADAQHHALEPMLCRKRLQRVIQAERRQCGAGHAVGGAHRDGRRQAVHEQVGQRGGGVQHQE